ncbi:hypothetical protein [Lentzea sp. NEAU-D7]|uniref:hypothetical protein n=1 Tax=Lentzea sp. NEAU-D7 TaxID=2994667 RepID=UPI00224AEE86|nr:hypothetical protein [Lentzea sp. NEAU-D7]MCX2953207.1 hypothetical protein [Lentzea sp. NEAU-D7]
MIGTSRGAIVLAVGVPALAACGAAAPVVAGVSGAAAGWLAEFGNEVRAEVAAKAVEGGKWVFEKLWENWSKPSSEMLTKQSVEGFGFYGRTVYGHAVPGTTFVSLHRARAADLASDRLACVRDSGEFVVLDSWAWKGVLAFVRQELGDKEGDDRLHVLQLLAGTLMPHGAVTPGKTPAETVSWVGYPTNHGGGVEIVKFTDGGTAKVMVKAFGYYTGGYGQATSHTFDLK